jgi:hypothetical protein
MDNDYGTWNAFHNQYWPAKYLVDRDGHVRYYHFGEGDYDETETAIRTLLGLEGKAGSSATEAENLAMTPETYVGHERAQNFRGKPEGGEAGTFANDTMKMYSGDVDKLGRTEWLLLGNWNVEGERAVAGKDAAIVMHYVAADVFLVMGGVDGATGTATVTDSAPDGKVEKLKIDQQMLYTLRQSDTQRDSVITVDVPEGVAVYAYTFG